MNVKFSGSIWRSSFDNSDGKKRGAAVRAGVWVWGAQLDGLGFMDVVE